GITRGDSNPRLERHRRLKLFVTTARSAVAAAGAAPGWIVAAAFAAAAAVDDTFRVRQLVAQAAFQAAAEARQLRRIQAQILLLRHLDRDGFERRQEGGAAKGAAAGAVATEHLRFIAHAYLPHLDSRMKLCRQFTNELAKINASVGGEVEDEPRSIQHL